MTYIINRTGISHCRCNLRQDSAHPPCLFIGFAGRQPGLLRRRQLAHRFGALLGHRAALAGSLVNSSGSDRLLSSLAISAFSAAIWCSAAFTLSFSGFRFWRFSALLRRASSLFALASGAAAASAHCRR